VSQTLTAYIRWLPIEVRRDVPTLVADRADTPGDPNRTFLRPCAFQGKYTLDLTGMILTPDASIFDLPEAIEPPHTVITSRWDSKLD
jgi:hypothetical protein